MVTDIEARLRHDLADEAATVTAAPPGLFADVLAGARRQRRNRLTAAGAAVCAVVAAVTVPLLVTGGPATGQTATPSTSSAHERYPYQPRGSLAGDAGYLQGLLDRPWGAGPDALDPTRRQVVFAGEVPGGVQALVVGRADGGWVGMWLHGAPGAAPADLEATNEPGRIDPSAPMSQSWTLDGTGSLVVLTRPGDVIEYSPGQVVDAGGAVTREDWQRVGDDSGLAVVPVGAADDLTRAIRVLRDGRVVEGGSGGGAAQGPIVPDPDLGPALAGAGGAPDAGLVRLELQTLLPELGLTADQVETHVLWGDAVPTSGAPDAVATVLTVRVPSGAVVVAGVLGHGRADASDGGGLGTVEPCLKEVLPAGTDVTATGLAMVCDVHDSRGGAVLGSRLVVLPPPGSTAVRLSGGSLPVHGPAVVADVPASLGALTAVGADGADLGVVPLYGVDDVRLTD